MLKVVRKCSYSPVVCCGRVGSFSRSNMVIIIIIITPEAEKIYVPGFKRDKGIV